MSPPLVFPLDSQHTERPVPLRHGKIIDKNGQKIAVSPRSGRFVTAAADLLLERQATHKEQGARAPSSRTQPSSLQGNPEPSSPLHLRRSCG